jgi:integrase
MASIKIKFRPSTVQGESGAIFYRIIHNRIARQVTTNYHIYSHEWDTHNSVILKSQNNNARDAHLLRLQSSIDEDMQRFNRIIKSLDQEGRIYTSDDVVELFQRSENQLFKFMQGVIASLKTLGKTRTAETYVSTLNSFMRFRESKDISLDDINSDLMMHYESYLRINGISPNSSSFYMRILRAVYNRAVEAGLTLQRFPFKHVYTGVDKTVKRGVPLKVIKRIKEMDFSMNPTFDFARDMFLMSFYTRGMSFVDMAYLRKKDLQNGVLSYRRRKTGQQLFIKWEKCMQDIVDKYDTVHSNYLLPIIKPHSDIDERKQYIYSAHNINRCLKIIGKELGVSVSLTLYVARHAWASIAKSKNVPLSVISEGMGHDSEATTRIYLASLDTLAIDKANSMILKSL